MTMPAVELVNVSRRYPGQPPVESLRNISLSIGAGELVAIVGPSGSGKTTLLNIVGTLDRPTSGAVRIAGVDTTQMGDAELSGFRAAHLGFVFQQFFLLDGMSILDNVADGMLYRGVAYGKRRRLAVRALDRVGLGHRLTHRPNQLSGGERQRAAIARALVGGPTLMLADEPTGNLDSAAGAQVLDLIRDLHRDGATIAVVTHNFELADAMDRRIELKDGCVVRESRVVRHG